MHCRICVNKDKDCIFLLPTPVIAASEADMEGDAKEAGTSMVVAVAEVPMAMEGIQVMEGTEGSIVKLSPMPEERAKGDHTEGVSWQHKQFEQELRVTSMDHALPAAEEAVVRALGEDSDVQEVLGASATATAAEPDAMEGVQRTTEETVPRQG